VREYADSAAGWLRAHAEDLGQGGPFWSGAPRGAAADQDPPSSAGPHPLDLPTAEQGVALAAIDSGRRVVEPGSDALSDDGEAVGSRPAPGLVDELRARDWITAERRDHTGRSACSAPVAGRLILIPRAVGLRNGD